MSTATLVGAPLIGIDLGGTKVRAALGDAGGHVVTQVEVPTRRDSAGLVVQLVDVVGELVHRAGLRLTDVRATAVGGAGVSDHGTFDLAPNLGSADSTDLAGSLASRLGHHVLLENDVNIAALGELHAGVGREVESFVFVAVGTGVGMGVVTDGRLLRGARGAAGEIGYLPLGSDPRDPAHHVRGPFEDAVSGPAIATRYAETTGRTVSTRAVFDAAAGGDPAAAEVVREAARFLAQGLVAVNAVLDPACFVLGGGVGSRPDLLDLVRAELPGLGVRLDVRHSAVDGDPAIVGALRLAAHALPLTTEGRPS